MMPQCVTENIFCSQMSAEHPWLPLYLCHKTKAESRGNRGPALLVTHRQPLLQGIYPPCSEPGLMQQPQTCLPTDTPLKDGQVRGNGQQQHFPNNTARSEPRCGRRSAAAFILGENEERLIDLGFFQRA